MIKAPKKYFEKFHVKHYFLEHFMLNSNMKIAFKNIEIKEVIDK